MGTTKRIALVTGGNKGIGLEVVRQLAKAGWTVYLGARDEKLGREAAEKLQAEGLDVSFVFVDLERPETITAAADSIGKLSQRLNVLVNNAGISPANDGPASKVDLSVVDLALRTNYRGTLAVTQVLLPLLVTAGNAQIVNVSSELGCISEQTNDDWRFSKVKLHGYSASKAALNMLTVQLAHELRDAGVAVNSVNPGFTATDLNGHRGSQTVEEGAAEIVRLALLDQAPTGKFLETGGEVPW